MSTNKKILPLKEAIKFVKDNAQSNFDETIEAHFNLEADVSHADQTIRVTAKLPHGTGKTLKIAVLASKKVPGADLELTEADLVKLEKSQIRPKVDFDLLIVEPKFMAKLGKLGPILGPAGVMPNPKTGTVTEKIEEAVTDFKKGKVELRNEGSAPIIHTIIGKSSFTETQLSENFMEIISTLKSNKPQKVKPDWIKNCFLTSTMGQSVLVDLNLL